MDGPIRMHVSSQVAAGVEPFGSSFENPRTRKHLAVYVGALVSRLPRKSARAIAQAFGVAARTLERFLSQSRWSPEGLRDRLQQSVARDHGSPDAIALMIDVGTPKKRGWGRATTWVRNPAGRRRVRGITTIRMAYVGRERAGFLDGELFVAKEPPRSRPGAIEREDVPGFRPKSRIALEQLDIARSNGIEPDWFACSEAFFDTPSFLKELAARNQRMLGLLSSEATGWVTVPEGSDGPDDLTLPGLLALSKSRPLRAYCWARTLRELNERHPALCHQSWQSCRTEGEGSPPRDWSVRRVAFVFMGPDCWACHPLELVVYRPAKARFGAHFVVTSDASASNESIVRAAERARRAAWELDELLVRLGSAHFSGRSYTGLRRHLTLGSLASWLRQELPGERRVFDDPIHDQC